MASILTVSMILTICGSLPRLSFVRGTSNATIFLLVFDIGKCSRFLTRHPITCEHMIECFLGGIPIQGKTRTLTSTSTISVE
jgi:hypothetical protein